MAIPGIWIWKWTDSNPFPKQGRSAFGARLQDLLWSCVNCQSRGVCSTGCQGCVRRSLAQPVHRHREPTSLRTHLASLTDHSTTMETFGKATSLVLRVFWENICPQQKKNLICTANARWMQQSLGCSWGIPILVACPRIKRDLGVSYSAKSLQEDAQAICRLFSIQLQYGSKHDNLLLHRLLALLIFPAPLQIGTIVYHVAAHEIGESIFLVSRLAPFLKNLYIR